jgi:anti-sigma factor RsiW
VAPVRTDRCGHEIDLLLHKRADGRLSTDEASALERLTSACTACRERSLLLDWTVETFRHEREVPVHLPDAVMRRLPAVVPSRTPGAPSRPAFALRWAPLAAALTVGIGALVVYQSGRPAPPDVRPPVEVELQLANGRASSVAVAGDFNGWDAVGMTKGTDGVFRVRLALSPGRYQYAFLVDGQTWVADPRAATIVDSGYGGADSVLDLSL